MYLPLSQISKAFGLDIESKTMISSVTTDSRDAKAGTIFVGMKGKNEDGSKYAISALNNGAALALVENLPKEENDRLIKVPSGRLAMIKLGGLVRDRFDIPFVAVTGSVGKTTTKDFIACVLNTKYRTHKNIESKNDEIGVPQTVFSLNEYHQAAVIEMGMDHFGDIKLLSDIIRPKVGVITCIGNSHIENFTSKENILKGKLQIVSGMKKGSKLILNGEDELLKNVRLNDYDIKFFGFNSGCDAYATDIKLVSDGTLFNINYEGKVYPCKINAYGEHIVLDAVCAFLTGMQLGLDPLAASNALSNYMAQGMRQHIRKAHGYIFVEDCYNCSPESLIASTKTFSKMVVEGRKILVLSDMLELGKEKEKIHRDCGKFINALNLDAIFAYGVLSKFILQEIKQNSYYYDSKAELIKALKEYIKPNDTIWFKASHAQHLEEVIYAL